MPSAPDTHLKRVNVTMPAPTLSGGRPAQPWTPTTTSADWGWLKVKVRPKGGSWTDMSWVRGVPCVVESFGFGDPLAESTARVRFPQFTIFDDIGAGDWAALGEFKQLDVVWVTPGAVETTLWEGYIAAFDVSQSGDEAGLTVDCMGALWQVGLYRRAPGVSDNPDAL